MEGKRGNDLQALTEIADSDVLIVDTGEGTRKITYGALCAAVKNTLGIREVVESTNITEPGFLMDGKTASEALAELYSKNGAFSQFPKYPIDSYPNIWDTPSGFYVLYSADTGYLLEVPNEIPGSRVYILKSKITDTNFCMIFSSSRKALYMGYEYGTTHVWQKIVGMVL